MLAITSENSPVGRSYVTACGVTICTPTLLSLDTNSWKKTSPLHSARSSSSLAFSFSCCRILHTRTLSHAHIHDKVVPSSCLSRANLDNDFSLRSIPDINIPDAHELVERERREKKEKDDALEREAKREQERIAKASAQASLMQRPGSNRWTMKKKDK